MQGKMESPEVLSLFIIVDLKGGIQHLFQISGWGISLLGGSEAKHEQNYLNVR